MKVDSSISVSGIIAPLAFFNFYNHGVFGVFVLGFRYGNLIDNDENLRSICRVFVSAN